MYATITPGISLLNGLLRGELSAVETYAQAMKKVGAEPAAADLRRIASEHSLAAARLRELVLERGGEPTTDSKAWHAWTTTVLSVADLFANATACRALKQGEESLFQSYREALRHDQLPADCRAPIRDAWLPKQRDHLDTLDRLIDTLDPSGQ